MSKAVILDAETGESRLTWNGTTYVIRPPLLGQMRELDLLAEKVDRKTTADAERTAAAALEGDEEIPAETTEALSDRTTSGGVTEVLPWWRLLFRLCGDQPLPPDDECPLWMGTAVLIGRLQLHWVLHPFVALGSPDPPNPENP